MEFTDKEKLILRKALKTRYEFIEEQIQPHVGGYTNIYEKEIKTIKELIVKISD